jgi:hypothetical protein
VSAQTVFGGIGSGGWFLGIGSGTGTGGLFGGVGCGISTICLVATQFLFLINFVLVPLLFAVAFIVFLYGVANAYIFSRGDAEKVSKGHQHILWGILGFVIMISLWGIVNVVTNTFLLGGIPAPLPPTSFY